MRYLVILLSIVVALSAKTVYVGDDKAELYDAKPEKIKELVKHNGTGTEIIVGYYKMDSNKRLVLTQETKLCKQGDVSLDSGTPDMKCFKIRNGKLLK